MVHLQNVSAIYKFTKYRIIKKEYDSLKQFIQWFFFAIFSHVLLLVYQFTTLNYLFQVAYHTVFVFIIRFE